MVDRKVAGKTAIETADCQWRSEKKRAEEVEQRIAAANKRTIVLAGSSVCMYLSIWLYFIGYK